MLATTYFSETYIVPVLCCRTLGGCLDENSHCYTLEVSFYSYQTSATGQAMPYTEEGCILHKWLAITPQTQ